MLILLIDESTAWWKKIYVRSLPRRLINVVVLKRVLRNMGYFFNQNRNFTNWHLRFSHPRGSSLKGPGPPSHIPSGSSLSSTDKALAMEHKTDTYKLNLLHLEKI